MTYSNLVHDVIADIECHFDTSPISLLPEVQALSSQRVPECGAHQIIFRVSSAPPLALRRRLFGAAAFWANSQRRLTILLNCQPSHYFTYLAAILHSHSPSAFQSQRHHFLPVKHLLQSSSPTTRTTHHPPCHPGSARRTRERISIARNAPCSEVAASPRPPASPRLPRPPPRTLTLPRPQRPAAQTHTQTRTTTTIPMQHQASLHVNPAAFPNPPPTRSAIFH